MVTRSLGSVLFRRVGTSAVLAAVQLLLLASCEADSYDKGEGGLSLMQADLCELTVNGSKQATAFTTDEGEAYQFTTPFTASWIETADTTYRTVIYYNKVSPREAEPVTVGPVVTLVPREHWRFKELTADPLGLESVWLSTSKKYLNMGLLIRTGRISDEELPHSIGLAQDTLLTYDNGRYTACYRLLHSQNGIPQYYTNRRFVSILLPQPLPDTIRLTVPTFDGLVVKEVAGLAAKTSD